MGIELLDRRAPRIQDLVIPEVSVHKTRFDPVREIPQTVWDRFKSTTEDIYNPRGEGLKLKLSALSRVFYPGFYERNITEDEAATYIQKAIDSNHDFSKDRMVYDLIQAVADIKAHFNTFPRSLDLNSLLLQNVIYPRLDLSHDMDGRILLGAARAGLINPVDESRFTTLRQLLTKKSLEGLVRENPFEAAVLRTRFPSDFDPKNISEDAQNSLISKLVEITSGPFGISVEYWMGYTWALGVIFAEEIGPNAEPIFNPIKPLQVTQPTLPVLRAY